MTNLQEHASLVTGALGQDGFILCQQLRTKGQQVIGIGRPDNGHATRRRYLENLGCTFLEVDLSDVSALESVVVSAKPRKIFHLAAAHHSSDHGMETPELWRSMIAVNFAATEAMARTVVKMGIDCSLVYASSSQIWSRSDVELHVDETTPIQPSSFYGRTKAWATELLQQYRIQRGLRASVAILFNHESPWRPPSFVTRKISMAAAAALRGEPTPLRLMNIGARADWQAATDVVNALTLMSDSSAPDDYVIGSGVSHSVLDFVEAAYRHADIDWKGLVIPERDHPIPALVGVATKAARQLGWRPTETLDDIARQMVSADLLRLAGTMHI